ncbi:hypothetical protein ABPG75_006631 [Micractinium tetrahymenae]
MARVALLAVSLALLAACAPAHGETPKSVAELVIANENKGFGILLEAVLAADKSILAALSDPNLKATVFAHRCAYRAAVPAAAEGPDKAFAVLLKALGVSKAELLANKELLDSVLLYHVIGKPIKSSQIPFFPGVKVQTLLAGKAGKLSVRRGKAGIVRLLTTSGSQSAVIPGLANIRAGKSAIVHGINRVLVPGDKPL